MTEPKGKRNRPKPAGEPATPRTPAEVQAAFAALRALEADALHRHETMASMEKAMLSGADKAKPRKKPKA